MCTILMKSSHKFVHAPVLDFQQLDFARFFCDSEAHNTTILKMQHVLLLFLRFLWLVQAVSFDFCIVLHASILILHRAHIFQGVPMFMECCRCQTGHVIYLFALERNNSCTISSVINSPVTRRLCKMDKDVCNVQTIKIWGEL